MSQTPNKSVRRPEIDGLRALAAVWVMFDHFGLSRLVGMHYGFWGVRLMLILSAYFAARQLRIFWSGGGSPTWAEAAPKLVHYYTSRVIRLGLMAYGTILLAVALNVEGARGTWRWHAAFATNEWIVRYGDWPGSLSHFWSLAVQMQFLLILPLVMLLVGRRGFWPALAGGVAAAVAHRACAFYNGGGELIRWMPISNSLDAFCLGVALAWVERERPAWFARLASTSACAGALVCLAWVHWLRGHAYDTPVGLLTETGESVALVLLFGSLLCGRTFGPASWLLRFPPLVKLGAASLSLYALHPVVERVLHRLLFHPQPKWAWFPDGPAFGLLAAAVSLGVASVAFWLVEIPSRRIVAVVEPVLTRLFSGFSGRSNPFAFWRWQHAGTAALFVVLLYTSTAPLRFAPVLSGQEEPPIPIAGDTGGDDGPELPNPDDLPDENNETNWPILIDDRDHRDVA